MALDVSTTRASLAEDEGAGLTFDLQVSGTLGVSGGIGHFTRHGDFTVVQDQCVFASLLNDVSVLSNNSTMISLGAFLSRLWDQRVEELTEEGLSTSPFSFHWPWTSSSEISTSKRAVSPSNSSTP